MLRERLTDVASVISEYSKVTSPGIAPPKIHLSLSLHPGFALFRIKPNTLYPSSTKSLVKYAPSCPVIPVIRAFFIGNLMYTDTIHKNLSASNDQI